MFESYTINSKSTLIPVSRMHTTTNNHQSTGTGDKPIISTKKLISAAREFAEVVFGDGSGKENKGYGKFYPKQPSFLDEDDEEDLY